MNKRKCKSCQADVIWAETEFGRRMPLDAKPERRFVLSDGESARFVDTYQSHFATCPQADSWRGKKPSPGTVD